MRETPGGSRRPAGRDDRSAPDQTRIEDLSLAVDLANGLAARAARAGGRVILGIIGPPGSGKSTVARKIVQAVGDDAVLVPMDGFHLAQEELVRQGSRDRMGAPDTFDVGGFASLLTRLRRQDEEVVYAPDFDRSIEKPIAGSIAIPRRVPLVVTEGNYLLHDDDGWRVIAPLLDTTWYVEAPRALRTERLVARRIAHGDDPAHSEQWVRTVDARNARTVERTRALADVVLERGKGATSIALTASSLPRLDESVAVPDYDRRTGDRQIVHLGVGGFHRAHLAQYIDRLRRGGDLRWRLVGVGVLEHDRALRDALAAQDDLYTLVTVDPDGSEHARVIGALSQYLFAPEEPRAVIDALADPRTRIISMTITEGGYETDGAGAFSPRSEAVLADLAADDGAAPGSALGLIVAALERRRLAGAGGVTIMSCDNLPRNGEAAREAVRGFALRRAPDLAPWIDEHVDFPGSMVDRITPATTDRTRMDLAEHFGVEDAWPVRAESFIQWVVEDRFRAGRPAFEDVGARVVEDVTPYERMKLRLLNASHQALGHLGLLAGRTMVHEAMQDADIAGFVGSYMRHEALPTLGSVPGIDLEAYCRSLEERLAGEAVRDTLDRQVVDASDRLATFLAPVIRDRIAAGDGVGHGALILAGWRQRLDDFERSGADARELPDPLRDRLLDAVREDRDRPGAFLDLPEVLGDLASSPELRAAFLRARQHLVAEGLRSALRAATTARP